MSGSKTKLTSSVEAKRQLIEPHHPELSIRRQCSLLGLNRASFYYDPVPVDPFDWEVMRQIDAQYLETPFSGWPRMTAALRRKGYRVNGKRVRRLLRVMGLQAMTLRKRIATRSPGHQVYPYRLRDRPIDRPDLVWCADIPDVPMRLGFVYLVVVMDWFSRSILAWALSNSLDGSFCRQALQQALGVGTPAIFNTDQGRQFTASAFTTILTAAGVQIRMDGRGRVFDTILVARLWRTVNYAHLYLHDDPTIAAVEAGLQQCIPFYNGERPHQSLAYHTPAEVSGRRQGDRWEASWCRSAGLAHGRRPVKTGADAGRAASGRS